MPVRPSRRPGGRSARVRAAVLNAALDELAEAGYAEMSIQSIATRAGVNKTSVYRRWGTKGGVLADALLATSTDTEPPDTGDVRTDLVGLQATAPSPGAGIDAFARVIAITKALDAASDDPEIAAVRTVLWERRLTLMQTIVERAVERGQLPPNVDAELLLDVLFGAFHNRIVARGEPPTRAFFVDLMTFALRGAGFDQPVVTQPRRAPAKRATKRPASRS